MIFNWFKKYSATILDEKWNVIKKKVKLKFIPRTHELIFLEETNKYYRVINVVYNFKNIQGIYIIIEEYTDDFALLDKQKK
jgi:hypothetical protein